MVEQVLSVTAACRLAYYKPETHVADRLSGFRQADLVQRAVKPWYRIALRSTAGRGVHVTYLESIYTIVGLQTSPAHKRVQFIFATMTLCP